jgi:hypothetical protein
MEELKAKHEAATADYQRAQQIVARIVEAYARLA